jgi:hypothetical protein
MLHADTFPREMLGRNDHSIAARVSVSIEGAFPAVITAYTRSRAHRRCVNRGSLYELLHEQIMSVD